MVEGRHQQDDGPGPDPVDERAAQSLADALVEAGGSAWALTGAGMSTESGLPDYRGAAGMWRNRRFEAVASVEALRDEPVEFWDFYRMRLDSLDGSVPNAGHVALARLERAGLIQRVVTQNVDGLHGAAGSRAVLELHGSLREARCRTCGSTWPMDEARRRWIDAADGVPTCDCGDVLGPGVVLFGEALPPAIDEAFELAHGARLALALGTSLAVFPAAHLPIATVERGGKVAIVNRGSTGFDDIASVRIDATLGPLLERVADLALGTASA